MAAAHRPTLHAGSGIGSLRAVLGGFGAAVLGAAPHLLHHAGSIAGAALVAGSTGKVLFAAVGFIAAIPLLSRLHQRTGSWRVPVGALALLAPVFAFSSLIIGPALTRDGATNATSSPGSKQQLPSGQAKHFWQDGVHA